MDKFELLGYLAELDKHISAPLTLYIYGSAVVILLDAPERTSLDLDVAGPYSDGNQAELREVAERIGFPMNPDAAYEGPHIEWVGPLRLCLPLPTSSGMVLWQGAKLVVRTGSVEDIVASKLIRYDPTDRADIQYLFSQFPFSLNAVRQAVERLPNPFQDDILVTENLGILRADMDVWRSGA